MKVCQYVPHGAVPDIRGFAPAIVAQNLAKYISKDDGYVISNLERYSSRYDETEYARVFRIAEGKIYKRLFCKITKLDPYPLHLRAASIVKSNPVDIFHAHQLEFETDSFRKATGHKSKIVVHAHVTRTYEDKWGKADAYIAVSDYIKKRLVDRGFDGELIHVVPNGVDDTFFRPLDPDEKNKVKAKFNLPINATVLSFVGRKQEIKGFDIFLKTAQYLLEKSDDIYFLAVGSEPLDSKREATYEQRQQIRHELLGHPRYIELDALPHDKVLEIFQISDIVLQPSESETQGMAIVEAMSCGCAVISTNGSAIVESIEHQVDGLLINDRGDIEEIIGLINYGLANKNEIGKQARAKVMSKFSWQKVVSDLRRIYESL